MNFFQGSQMVPQTFESNLSPPSIRDEFKDRRFRTFYISLHDLSNRIQKDRKGPFGANTEDAVTSYATNDLVYTWKVPLLSRTSEFPITELIHADELKTYVYASFNGIDATEFRKLKTSDALMKNIFVPGIYAHTKPILLKEFQLNDTFRGKANIPITEEHTMTTMNVAHRGFTRKGHNGAFTYKVGKFQSLDEGDLLEWYFPTFDTDDFDKNNQFTSAWKDAFKQCIPREYRTNNRYTLLYRKYDPSMEDAIDEKYIRKFIATFWVPRHATMFAYDKDIFTKYLKDVSTVQKIASTLSAEKENLYIKMFRMVFLTENVKKRLVMEDIQRDFLSPYIQETRKEAIMKNFMNSAKGLFREWRQERHQARSRIFARVMRPAFPRKKLIMKVNFINPFMS